MDGDAPPSVTAPWSEEARATALPAGTIGRYRIERGLGVGGMGVVMAAFDPELGRTVAIKFLQQADPAAQERLIAEARAMARLNHPNVVAVHEVIRWGDRAGIVMELVDGPDLGRWLRERARPWPAIVDAYVQAARGLAAAHRAGLVHRDFKPANALIDDTGVVRVTDFGLARTIDEADGGTAGTPAYMAPEQRRGEAVDARTDQWALAYALRRALDSEQREGRPPPRRVMRALARATANAPGDRFADLDALCAAIGPRRRSLAYAGAGAAGLIAIGALVVTTRPAPPPPCATVASAELAETWNPGVRATMIASFGAQGAAALATGVRTASALDAHARAWRTARTTACTADRSVAIAPALSELRRACLARRQAELSALIAAFQTPSLETMTRSHATTFLLADPGTCLDLDEVRRREPLPDDPARRPAIAQARAELDGARARADVGRLSEARVELATLLAQARREGWQPLLAEVLVESGLAAAADRDFAAAERWLDEGVLVAEAAGYDLATVRGLIGLVEVRGRGLVRTDDGLALVPRARAVLARLGGDAGLGATLDTQLGRILLVQGKYDEALEVFTGVLAARRALDPRHPEVATSEIDLADALQKAGRSAEALPHYRTALALRQELFGTDHVLVARATFSVGNGLLELGDHAGATAAYEAALAAYEALYGPQHPVLTTPLNNLGYATILAGRPADALPVLERGLAIAHTSDHELIVRGLLEGNIGDALRRLGRFADARPYLERSLATFRSAYGPDNPQVITALVDLAVLELDRGDRAAATAHLQEAEGLTRALGADHPLTVEVRTRLAAAAGPRGDRRR